MNKQNNMKGRQRGRNGGKPRPQGRNSNYDGGNNNRMRGNAHQLMDKYLSMARDANAAGDRVLAENYYQHADHYYRVVNARMEQQQGGRRPYGDDRPGQAQNNGNDMGSDEQPQFGNGNHAQGPVTPPQTQFVQDQVPQMPADKPSPSSTADIGLPPGILGIAPEAEQTEEDDSEDSKSKSANGGRQSRARQQGRRRRTRSDASATAGE